MKSFHLPATAPAGSDARPLCAARRTMVADLRAELLSFPAGRHDDQVDALGLVGQLLDKINAGQKPKPPDVAQPDAYRPAFEEIPGDNWKTM